MGRDGGVKDIIRIECRKEQELFNRKKKIKQMHLTAHFFGKNIIENDVW